MTSPKLISCTDESGVICVYKEGKVIVPRKSIGGFAKSILDVFLPAGYPHTVTADYTPYQIYDSLQAFSSTIAGLLSSRAVLQGFGVGDSASTATAAVLLTVLQESTGRLATILFAHRCGRAIEAECKYYRFLADILNDSALVLDILSPALPPYPKVMALCASGILRALCGVSGGAAKASLSAHFAKNGNLAELNAKDGSQETVISLLGMLAGSLFVQVVHARPAVWASMAALIVLHLWTNYRAVRSVQMRTLNRQRATIIVAEYLRHGVILRPDQVAARECILKWRGPNISFASRIPKLDELPAESLKEFNFVRYVVTYQPSWRKVFMKKGARARDVIQAYFYAYTSESLGLESEFWKALESAGWDLDSNAIETGSTIRIEVG
ncbi:vitamin B6 photo-protection and homoeostasis-domain-containing protein [Xylariaceae sp. FL0662B]|nr:vitamin B6 photo-protection and homoeostasis-domain-containing protein [Xylariaceae sp. FL0662B]